MTVKKSFFIVNLFLLPRHLGSQGPSSEDLPVVVFCFWRGYCFLCPLQEIRVALPGKGTAAARAAASISISACRIFVCPNNGVATSVWDF